ncbi:unnamed protein product [Closterium sp. NIES-64]|nr:unnamed protein product [Closterium sp. NIES-64]
MAPAEDGDGEAADEPSNDAPARTGLDFLRAVHANPPPVVTPGPSSCSKGKQSLSPPPASNAVMPDSAPATVSVSEVGESSSAASKKRRGYAQAVLPFGTPPAKPTPPPAPVQAPKRVSRELTDAEKAEERFLKAQQLYITHKHLSKFIKQHGGDNRTAVVEGIDSEGRQTSHKFELSETPIKKHKFGGTLADCEKLCTGFAKEVVARMKYRIWDLQQLGGAKLFQVESWPSRDDQRELKTLEWLAANDELFGGMLPGEL